MNNKKIKSITDAKELESIIEQHQQSILEAEEQLKKIKWTTNRDILNLGDGYPMYVAANRSSWDSCKKNSENEGDESFYFNIDNNCTSITIEDAKLLRNYLNQKIIYLES